MPLTVASIWATLWIVLYILLSGSITESEYPSATRIYKLPFPGGESSWVMQGNNSKWNHNNDHNGQKFSWDFRRRCGTPVLAARPGTIQKVTDGYDGVGGDNNNEIRVTHYKQDVIKPGNEDGTVAYYLHIQKDSAKELKMAKGTTVSQGQQIAKVGSVGNSITGHIHFMVKNDKGTVAVSFTDVSEDKGIPRGFHSYTSGNRKVP
jgi:murein DD-endopeptidase MepM/ murein hydrolase activator NlpD